MTRSIARAIVAVALLAVSPAGAVIPATCADPCTITTVSGGYIAPVTVVASTTTVSWRSVDSSHPTSDSSNGSARCFWVEVGPEVTPTPVKFKITNQGLRATKAPGTAHAETATCTTATLLPTGGYLLPYMCLIHPWMRGTLVVEPAA